MTIAQSTQQWLVPPMHGHGISILNLSHNRSGSCMFDFHCILMISVVREITIE